MTRADDRGATTGGWMDAERIGRRVRRLRRGGGLSQEELASRAGVSRQSVGALEAGRHLPRVDAAVGLATALGVTVEELVAPVPHRVVHVLGEVLAEGQPIRAATVGDRTVCVPVPGPEDGECWRPPDGVIRAGGVDLTAGAAPTGLIAVGCDPALGIIADLAAASGERILAVSASSGAAREALSAGRAHVGLVHDVDPADHLPGLDVHRIVLSRWRTGLAASPGVDTAIDDALRGHGSVVQRDPGAGAQRAYLRALQRGGVDAPGGPLASGHVDAARRASHTGAAAVTIEPVAQALGLRFRPLETHTVEVWISPAAADLPGTRVLGEIIASARLRDRMRAVAGYELGPAA